MTGKIYDGPAAALEGLLFDGMTIMSGGFGLSGNPESLIPQIRDSGVKNITVISNNAGADGFGLWMLLDEVPRSRRTAYTDDEFCDALAAYRTQDIAASLHSEDPLVRMLAILDRRVGKRTLSALRDTVSQQPEWLQNFYRLRMDAEDFQHKL